MRVSNSSTDFKTQIPNVLHHKFHFVEHYGDSVPAYSASLNFGFKAPDGNQLEHSIIADSLESLIDQLERAPDCRCDYCKVTLAQQTVVRRTQFGSASKKEYEQALGTLASFGRRYSKRQLVDVVEDYLAGDDSDPKALNNAALSIAQDCIIALAE